MVIGLYALSDLATISTTPSFCAAATAADRINAPCYPYPVSVFS